jgi:hypothetical protein
LREKSLKRSEISEISEIFLDHFGLALVLWMDD